MDNLTLFINQITGWMQQYLLAKKCILPVAQYIVPPNALFPEEGPRPRVSNPLTFNGPPRKNLSAIVIVLSPDADGNLFKCPHWNELWRTQSSKITGKFAWTSSSFLKNPMSPPAPANSWLKRNKVPSLGNKGSSRLSTVSIWCNAVFRLWPQCSRTSKLVPLLRLLNSRQIASALSKCEVWGADKNDRSRFIPLPSILYPDGADSEACWKRAAVNVAKVGWTLLGDRIGWLKLALNWLVFLEPWV